MRSLSLEMLKMADYLAKLNICCSSRAKSEQDEEEAKESQGQQEQDDSIPCKTQRHLASFLATHSNQQEARSEDFLPLLTNSPYINQKQKILNRTILEPPQSLSTPQSVFAAWVAKQFERRLQELPAEVLCMIENYLDPSDLVCLGRTCRALYQAVDYQMVDLRNLEFAEDLWPVLREHGLDFALAKERYKIIRRLQRDRLEVLQRHAKSADWLPCSACIKIHPRRYFSPSEQRKSVPDRKCLASTASIRICSHWAEDLLSLRRRQEESDCEPRPVDFFRTDKCTHVDHEFQGFSAPQMRDIGATYSVERYITPLQTDDREAITEEFVRDVLASDDFKDIRICPHTRLDDEAVTFSFRRRPQPDKDEANLADRIMAVVGYLPEFEPSGCKECGRSWQFSILDNLGCRQSPRYALRLIVDDQIKPVKDPWTEEYLRKVEGGRGLMRLMEM